MKSILITLIASSLVALGQTNLPPDVNVRVKNIPLEDGTAINYAIMQIDGRQMGFEVPPNMIMHKFGNRVTMEDKDMRDNAGISVGPFTPEAAPEGTPIKSIYIASITNRFPGATITTEFTLTAGGHPGAAFDAVWYKFGQSHIIRTVYVPVGGTVIQFQLTVIDENFKRYKNLFNTVLVTFRDGQGGQVDAPKFSSKL